MSESINNIINYLSMKTNSFEPKIGIILGSGLASLVDEIDNPISIPYADIPGFFDCSVAGHHGTLHFGYLEGVPVVCMQGRGHLYEGLNHDDIATPIRVMKQLGIETLLLTNAAGSLREALQPGSLMLIHDHINFQGTNPLIGKNDDSIGPRFVGMENAYDSELRKQMLAVASEQKIPLSEGVYVSVLGPNFETPAEIKAFQILGGDAVGMSTVPEVIVARHCGLNVVAISAITNMGAGMTSDSLSHEHTLEGAKLSITKLKKLVCTFIATSIEK